MTDFFPDREECRAEYHREIQAALRQLPWFRDPAHIETLNHALTKHIQIRAWLEKRAWKYLHERDAHENRLINDCASELLVYGSPTRAWNGAREVVRRIYETEVRPRLSAAPARLAPDAAVERLIALETLGGAERARDEKRITRDPRQMSGVACIRGLRITVRTILACLADGMGTEEILRDYPDLEPADLGAALRYAALALDADPIPGYPAPTGDETVEDLVDLDGLEPLEADVIRRAAEAALDQGIEPGTRRARFIDGWRQGHRAGRTDKGDA